jgi:sugar phosphate isomerase/epimerase
MLYGAMNFPIIPIVDEIDSIASLGFDYIEIAMDQPEAHYSSLAENQSAVRRALESHGIGVVCHLPTFVSTADLTDSIRRASVTEMKRSLSVAADLGAEKVVLHPSMISGMGPHVPERSRDYAFDFLSEMLGQGEKRGLTICLENMMPRNGFGVEPAELELIFRTFPELKFTLDSGHANLDDREGNRLITLVECFADRLEHVHLSDNRGIYDEHLPLGRGSINIHGLVEMLKSIAYDKTITLEVFVDNSLLLVESREMVKAMLV